MAPPVAGAIAKIQQTLDRSGIQFKVRLEQDKVSLSRRCQALRQAAVGQLTLHKRGLLPLTI